MAYYDQPMETDQPPQEAKKVPLNYLIIVSIACVACILVLVWQMTQTIDSCNAYWREQIVEHNCASLYNPKEYRPGIINISNINMTINGEMIAWKT